MYYITPHIQSKDNGNIIFDHESTDTLAIYTPFHDDLDIESMMVLHTNAPRYSIDQTCEPFTVEEVIQKWFHPQRQQYEFLVKWKGYTSAENTWELASNIPEDKISEFDRHKDQRPVSRRDGLRETRKCTSRKDFINTF